MPFFSIGELKNAREVTPPAGRKTLTRFLFKKSVIASPKWILLPIVLKAAMYIRPLAIR